MSDIQRLYGEALFKIANEENADDELKKDLTQILKSFNDKEDIKSFLALMNEGLFSSFDEIFEGFSKQYDEKHNTLTVFALSALELSNEEKNMLKTKIENQTGKDVNLVCNVDSDLIGGMIVKIDGQEIDGSIKARLERIKDEIVQ